MKLMSRVKHFLLFLTSITCTVEPIKAQHFCKFALLPQEIQNHIVSYIRFANKVYEAHEFFVERIQQSEGMLKKQQIARKQIPLWTNGKGEDIDIDGRYMNYRPTYSKQLKHSLHLQYFISSTNNDYVTTLAREESMYFSAKDVIEVFRWKDSQYLRGWFNNSNSFNCIRGVAVSNDGQVAIVKRNVGIFSVNLLNKNEDIQKYQAPLKCHDDNYLCWATKIVDVLFNQQGTKLGIKLHFLSECLLDETHVDEKVFRKLLKEWFIQSYKHLSLGLRYKKIIELLDQTIDLHKDFWNALKLIVNDADLMLKINAKIQNGNNEFCPITIIPLQDEEPWTLSKYFILRGICKNLDAQCGFKKKVENA